MKASAQPVRTNWAGNYTYTAAEHAWPATVPELQELITTQTALKAVGTRHAFNHIADTRGTQVSLSQFKDMTLDADAGTATVGGGVTYGELAPWLDRQGFAVHNLASLPHIAVAGACATATHGSGLGNGCLASAVTALEMVNGQGDGVSLFRDRDGDAFRMAVVNLGALGVVTRLTLKLVPRFEAAQMVYENLDFDTLQQDLRAVFGAGYSVSLFTDWQGHRATQAWVKRRLGVDETPAFPQSFWGATQQRAKLHPLPGLAAESCTAQNGEAGPWYERLPHFRLDYTPSAGAELQTEYFVPLEQGFDAVLAVEQLRDRITPHLLISELRTIAADDLPMSMAYRRDSLALHFTWKPELASVLALLPSLEAQLEPFAARPHWAKLFTTPPERVRALYPEFDSFARYARAADPQGRFCNDFLRPLLHG